MASILASGLFVAHVLVRILELEAPPKRYVTELIEQNLRRLQTNVASARTELPENEELVAIAADATVLWVLKGGEEGVVIPPERDAVLYQSGAGIVLVHNHPRSASFSAADLEHLGKPGVASIVVVGHDGSIYLARAGARFETKHFISNFYPMAQQGVRERLRLERPSTRVTTAVIDANFEHLVAVSLHKANVIYYRSVLSKHRQPDSPQWLRLSGLVTNAVAQRLK